MLNVFKAHVSKNKAQRRNLNLKQSAKPQFFCACSRSELPELVVSASDIRGTFVCRARYLDSWLRGRISCGDLGYG